jgi:hypothetical protein
MHRSEYSRENHDGASALHKAELITGALFSSARRLTIAGKFS